MPNQHKVKGRTIRPPSGWNDDIDEASQIAGLKPHAWMVRALREQLDREGFEHPVAVRLSPPKAEKTQA